MKSVDINKCVRKKIYVHVKLKNQVFLNSLEVDIVFTT